MSHLSEFCPHLSQPLRFSKEVVGSKNLDEIRNLGLTLLLAYGWLRSCRHLPSLVLTKFLNNRRYFFWRSINLYRYSFLGADFRMSHARFPLLQ